MIRFVDVVTSNMNEKGDDTMKKEKSISCRSI